ncbi:NAD(+) diphosphatase [Allonocardiopsis opalescens]|uniref:NAD(+) diphosphatase n=1 Tax=Allonocardiopsis opalescens TaxID=1144618 RepID=A0A2T0QDQ6_9ACTN|nr:NAD(+) diphosphatase [Allonocardiopsis opalescens]PRY02001.1 NAD+ diphosphatase [Allonocardiopsis opalescens]
MKDDRSAAEARRGGLRPALSRSGVDLAGYRRKDDAWLAAAWADPRTRVLVVAEGHALVAGSPPGLMLVEPAAAPEGERILLGVDGEGVAYFSVHAPLPVVEGGAPGDLRRYGALLSDRDAGLLTQAAALDAWHAGNRFCPRCGGPTRLAAAGHVRICEREGIEHFPRTDPAVIMLVHDGDRCLLAHNPRWPDERRVSVLAGFVEAGESAEQAVVREVAEEVGVAVQRPEFLGSQPWPFPRSLMLGFTARATGRAERTDFEEITQVYWFTRAELREAVDADRIRLPGSVSIARKLIEHWYGGELPGEW